jgi:sec-independent protein translocase protein TatB
VFDLSLPKLLLLAVLALVVFGPNELPKMAAKAGRALRDLRRIAEGAQADLRDGLGPEFSDFSLDDLNPRRFVQNHLLSEPKRSDLDPAGPGGADLDEAGLDEGDPGDRAAASASVTDGPSPYDSEAT